MCLRVLEEREGKGEVRRRDRQRLPAGASRLGPFSQPPVGGGQPRRLTFPVAFFYVALFILLEERLRLGILFWWCQICTWAYYT